MTGTPQMAGYTRTQIVLHWAVVVLILVQFVSSPAMESAWDAWRGREPALKGLPAAAGLHILSGLSVLVLALWRLRLRYRYGVPPLPRDEHPMMKLLAQATHALIYALMIVLPISGATAWFLGVEAAGDVHEIAKNILFVAIVLHIAGALIQHLLMRSDVLVRMLRPVRR